MSRREFKDMVRRGDLTADDANEIVIEIARLVNRGVETGSIPNLSKLMYPYPKPMQRGDSDQEKLAEIFRRELCQSGGIGCFARSNENYQVIFHWPTIFAHGFENTRSMYAKIVWLMQAIVRRRSPLLFSFLRRKYLTDLIPIEETRFTLEPRFTEKEFEEVHPLEMDEYDLLADLGKKFAVMLGLGDICNRAFLGMLAASGVALGNRYAVLKMWKENINKSSPLYWESTLISRRRLNELKEVLLAGGKAGIPDAQTDKFGFGASNWGQLTFDVLCIPHYATPDGRFGVISMALGEKQLRHMVINLPLYLQQQAHEDKYSKFKRLLDKMEKNKPEEIRDEAVKLLGIQFPLMLDNIYRRYVHCSEYWPRATFGDIYAVPVEVFEQYRQASRKMSALRSNIKQAAKITRRPGFNQIVQLHSPRIPEAGNAVFAFRAIHRDGEVYISPGWESVLDDTFFRGRNYGEINGERALRPGIVLNDGSGEYYYALNKYAAFPDTPIMLYPALSRWLFDFLGIMTKEDFLFLWRSAKRLPSFEVHVPRGGNKRAYPQGSLGFSEDADQIILKHLRPGKLVTVAMTLEKIGIMQTTDAITKRGAVLREQAILEGCFDLDQLPHVNYSSILGKRLKKLRTIREQEQRNKELREKDKKEFNAEQPA
jgi:hypothetical protein